MSLLNGTTTCIVATVGEEGKPNAAPFNFVVAKDPFTLLIGVNLNHQTLQNIRHNGQIAVSIIGEGIAVTVHGKGRVIKEKMGIGNDAMVEVKIDKIKDDHIARFPILSGIQCGWEDEGFVNFLKNGIKELQETNVT